MYFIPTDFDLTRLYGAIVQQICFTANNISLLLEDLGYITFEGQFSLFDGDGNGNGNNFYVYPVNNDFGLLRLIEQQIERVATNEKRSNLTITFKGGVELTLIGAENYESFAIKIGNDEIRV